MHAEDHDQHPLRHRIVGGARYAKGAKVVKRVDCDQQAARARAFRELHTKADGDIIVLPNAFDVATARLIARLKPAAIGTTNVGWLRIGLPDMRTALATCNSAPALMVYSGDRLDLVVTVEVVDGKISMFYAIRNPDKLAALGTAREISR
jgi:2-methylisocitrate lyase-like PEP mutase family enzyme